MVSDFIEEHCGYLSFSDDELAHTQERYPNITQHARQLLEYGTEKEAYWTGDRSIAQVKTTLRNSSMVAIDTQLYGCLLKAVVIVSLMILL